MKVKLLLAALLASWIFTGVFAYLWIDRSITATYLKQSADIESTSTMELQGLLESEWKGMPDSSVFEKLQTESARHPDRKTVLKRDKDGTIWFDEIRFNFEQGKLKDIGSM